MKHVDFGLFPMYRPWGLGKIPSFLPYIGSGFVINSLSLFDGICELSALLLIE